MKRRHWSTLFRSLLIQGSWNYHHLVGGGFGFALLPILRHRYADDDDGFDQALRRHIALFNTHPYLSGIALGATARLEEDGADGTTIERFKAAIRGPLGSLGDALVWATFLPACLVFALGLAQLGVAPWIVVLAFLVPYNAVHLWIRIWGFRHGLDRGRQVGGDLRTADLPHWTWRVARTGTALLGVLVGLLLVDRAGVTSWPSAWVALAVLGFLLGALRGEAIRRLTWYGFVAALVLVLVVGSIPEVVR